MTAPVQDREAPYAQEYEADAMVAQLAISLAEEQLGSQTVGYWGCDLVLRCLHQLYWAMACMEYGPGRYDACLLRLTSCPLSRR